MKLHTVTWRNALVSAGCILFLLLGNLNAQEVVGSWEGKLKVQGVELRIVFNLSETDGVYNGTMDSPDQNAFGIPLSSVFINKDSVQLELQAAGISYIGKLEGTVIEGEFKQGNFAVEMPLHQTTSEVKERNRPQEPKPPFAYGVTEVEFLNKAAEIHLSGTLTLPEGEGPFPGVVLISGSGAQNRDEEIFGHKPFLLIADHFTKAGIAVLRFDDRGTGKSEGDHQSATSADFATDVSAAVDFLLGNALIDKKKIGLVGHSEGGLIAPMVHLKRSDIAFMVLLAGTGVRGDTLMLAQQRLVGKANGMTDEQLDASARINKDLFEIVNASNSAEDIAEAQLRVYLESALQDEPSSAMMSEADREAYVSGIIQRLNTPWMRFFLGYNPADALEKTTCAVLALNGTKDLQVPASMNLDAISKALIKAGNNTFEAHAIEGLNHLFQECETGAPSEYGSIEQTMAPVVLRTMIDWIHKTTN